MHGTSQHRPRFTKSSPNLAISDARVFGNGSGAPPATPAGLTARRDADPRNVFLAWETVPGAVGYNVLWGIAPDKLYSSWMVYDKSALELKSLTVDQSYYFAVEAFNENGVSERTPVVRVE